MDGGALTGPPGTRGDSGTGGSGSGCGPCCGVPASALVRVVNNVTPVLAVARGTGGKAVGACVGWPPETGSAPMTPAPALRGADEPTPLLVGTMPRLGVRVPLGLPSTITDATAAAAAVAPTAASTRARGIPARPMPAPWRPAFGRAAPPRAAAGAPPFADCVLPWNARPDATEPGAVASGKPDSPSSAALDTANSRYAEVCGSPAKASTRCRVSEGSEITGSSAKTRAADTLRGRFGPHTGHPLACCRTRSRSSGVTVPAQPRITSMRSGQA